MSGSKPLPDEEVILYQNKIVTIILDELQDYKRRRIGRTTLNEVFRLFWISIATELISGNRVVTPLGTFTPYVTKKYNNISWELAGIKKSIRPKVSERVRIKFKESSFLRRSIQNLIERADEQEARIHRQESDRRGLERAARRKQRPTNERMGRKAGRTDDSNIR